jgi:hypothetical protein
MPSGVTQLLAGGLGFPQSMRWREGRIWLCNWGAGEVLAVAARPVPPMRAVPK